MLEGSVQRASGNNEEAEVFLKILASPKNFPAGLIPNSFLMVFMFKDSSGDPQSDAVIHLLSAHMEMLEREGFIPMREARTRPSLVTPLLQTVNQKSFDAAAGTGTQQPGPLPSLIKC